MTDIDPDLAAYQSLAASGPLPRDGMGRYQRTPQTIGHQSPATESEALAEANAPPAPMVPPKPMEKPAGDAVTAEDLEAFQGLAKRFGVPQRLQEGAKDMDRAELLAWTASLRKTQDAFDKKAAAPEGAPKDGKPSQKAGTPKAGTEGAPEAGEKGSDKRSKIIDAFAANGIDEDAANAVLSLLDERGEQPPQDQTAMQDMVEMVRSMQEKQARTEVEEKFPGLKDDKRYEKVRARVARWIANGDYEPTDVASAMVDAARIEFFDDAKTSKPRRGDPPTSPKDAREGRSEKDPDREAYDRLARGEGADAIKTTLWS